MTERSLGETYNKSYVAIPITESPLFKWVQSINGNKAFYHITVFFLGSIDDKKLAEVKGVMSSINCDNKHLSITPEKLDFVGANKDAFILKINETEKLLEIRKLFEKYFPENLSGNCTFLPHITIERAKRGQFSKYDVDRLLDKKDLSDVLDPYEAHNVGLYYRTEEGATALLYSKKI